MASTGVGLLLLPNDFESSLGSIGALRLIAAIDADSSPIWV